MIIGIRSLSAYNSPVADHSAAGRENPMTLGALALLNGAFFMRCPSMAGDAGQSARAGRVPSSRFLTPASFATILVRRDVADSHQTRSLL
jgi:hypothetical protein